LQGSIVIPAQSACRRAKDPIYVPAGAVRTVRTTSRGVGVYTTAGQWVLLWEGDDQLERDLALAAFLVDLSGWYRR
jgi:hypothetical protein